VGLGYNKYCIGYINPFKPCGLGKSHRV
jgi:hypothetical protein